jgi:hypothetical protein
MVTTTLMLSSILMSSSILMVSSILMPSSILMVSVIVMVSVAAYLLGHERLGPVTEGQDLLARGGVAQVALGHDLVVLAEDSPVARLVRGVAGDKGRVAW